MPCDVSLISNVKRSAADIVAKHPKVDFLLITAGVLAAARTLTAEGLDKASAVHYYGRWAFIHELLPALRAARGADADAKVISVFSAGRGYSAHDPATYNDLMCEVSPSATHHRRTNTERRYARARRPLISHTPIAPRNTRCATPASSSRTPSQAAYAPTS